jgi:gallate decarboxylase subunit D
MGDGNGGHGGLSRHPVSPVGKFSGVVRVGRGRTGVELSVGSQGRDWILQITGGEAHVGAVATAFGHGVQLALIGSHKEGPLAEMCAGRWARLTGRVCVAIVGIHQDQATRQEIESIVDNVQKGLDVLVNRWQEADRADKSGP